VRRVEAGWRGRLAIGLALTVVAPLPLVAETRPSFTDLTEDVAARIEYVRAMLGTPQSRIVRDHIVSVGPGLARIAFVYDDGGSLTLALDQGQVELDGRLLGHYPARGAFQAAWQALVVDLSRRSTPDALDALRAWSPEGLSREEQAWVSFFHDRLGALTAPTGLAAAPRAIPQAPAGGLVIPLDDLRNPASLEALFLRAAELKGAGLMITVPGGQAHLGHYSVGSAERVNGHVLVLHGDADVFGTVQGNVAAVDGNIVVHPGAVITGDVLAVAGEVRDVGGDVSGQILTSTLPRGVAAQPRPAVAAPAGWAVVARNAAGVAGVFITMLLVGFGLVLFGRPPLEVMSDTALHSFGRAFLVGLLGQMLVIPTFGAIIVGLVLSVAGILLVPFAVLIFALLFISALLGGFLAIAHAMGETVTRRQLARGLAIAHANSYRYVAVGLGSVAVLWLSWAAFGWVPVAGSVVFGTASLATWLLATVGFGAALLSRVGLREHFAGRIIPQEALTDEYLWATPQFGVTAVKRPIRTPVPRD
jgi:hypothetical protein